MKKNNKKGFTIVELVIVIAVIAILAGVLIPTFAGIITKANKSAAEQEAQSVYKEVYALDLSDGVQDGKDNKVDIVYSSFEGLAKDATFTYAKPEDSDVYTFTYTTAKGYTATFNGTTWTVAAPAKQG